MRSPFFIRRNKLMLVDLFSAIQGHAFSLAKDKWLWKRSFIFSSVYNSLLGFSNPSISNNFPFPHLSGSYLQGSWASSKAIMFSAAPPRQVAFQKEFIPQKKVIANLSLTSCPFCDRSIKSASYLFVTCEVASLIQYKIISWLGWQIAFPKIPTFSFESFYSLGGRMKSMGEFSMNQHVVVWIN